MPKPYTLEWWEEQAKHRAIEIDKYCLDGPVDISPAMTSIYAQLILAADKAAGWAEKLKREKEGL